MKKLFVTVFVSLWIVFLLTVISAEAAKQHPRSFYLTQDTFKGSQALTACADGYHMASLWEILDVTNLRYDTSLGIARDDSGSGPPTQASGWIRTGYIADGGAQVPGIANCDAWTSDNANDRGTFAQLNAFWTASEFNIMGPWFVGTDFCDSQRLVWCVQD